MHSKQMIVMRKDLKMRKGKMIAQGAHASIKVFLDLMNKNEDNSRTLPFIHESVDAWIDGAFTKICLGVNSEEELDALYLKAQELNIPCAMIIDNGLTEFHGVKTKTCIAIGPYDAEIIDTITRNGHLELL